MSLLTKKLKIEDLDKKLSFILMYRNELNYAMIVVSLFLYIGASSVSYASYAACVYISALGVLLGLARVYDQCRDNEDEISMLEETAKRDDEIRNGIKNNQ
jgi:hypothetical protein